MMIRVATVQFEPRPDAAEYNFARVERFARVAADDAVQLVAFPELRLIGNRHLARRSPGYLRLSHRWRRIPLRTPSFPHL